MALNYTVVEMYGLSAYPFNITARGPRLEGEFYNGPRCMVGFVGFMTDRLHRCVSGLNMGAISRLIKEVSLVGEGRNVAKRTTRISLSGVLSAGFISRGIRCGGGDLCSFGLRSALSREVLYGRFTGILTGNAGGGIRIGIGGASHSFNAVFNSRIAEGRCGALSSSAFAMIYGNSNNRDFNTFVPGKLALRLINSSGSCFNGKLSNNGLMICPPGGSAFSTNGGVVVNGITLCNTADNGTFVGNITNRHFYMEGSNTATIIRNINSRNYRCVANNQIIIVNGANGGFTTNVSNNITCILSRRESLCAGLGGRVILFSRMARGCSVVRLGALVRRRITTANSRENGGVLSGFSRCLPGFGGVVPRSCGEVVTTVTTCRRGNLAGRRTRVRTFCRVIGGGWKKSVCKGTGEVCKVWT